MWQAIRTMSAKDKAKLLIGGVEPAYERLFDQLVDAAIEEMAAPSGLRPSDPDEEIKRLIRLCRKDKGCDIATARAYVDAGWKPR